MRIAVALRRTSVNVSFAMLLLVPVTGRAQVARVRVTDTRGMPVPGLELRLVSFDSMRVVAATVAPVAARGPFIVAGPSPRGRYVTYIVAACADGWMPQAITAPFARGDTLELSMRMAPATSRGHVPTGPGACAWQADSVARIRIAPLPNFVSRAALTSAELDSLADAVHGDSSGVRARVHSVMARLDQSLRTARSGDDQQRAAYMRLGLQLATDTPLTKSMRARLQAALPPASRWWALASYRVQGLTMQLFDTPDSKDHSPHAVTARTAAQFYLQQMAASIGEPEIRSEARYELTRLTFDAGDSARAQTLLDRLLGDQAEYPFARLAAARFSKVSSLRRGTRMPAFDFVALPDTMAPHVTNAAIHGKLTLVSFWGTWCGPCREELPALAHVYARYHARGLDIISVAADESPDVVNQFQRKNHSMPWTSAYGGAVDAPEFHRLGVLIFPRTVLVDANGMIVASAGKLSEAELTTMVESALGR